MHVPEGNVIPVLLIVYAEELKPFKLRILIKRRNDTSWSELERSMLEEFGSPTKKKDIESR